MYRLYLELKLNDCNIKQLLFPSGMKLTHNDKLFTLFGYEIIIYEDQLVAGRYGSVVKYYGLIEKHGVE